MTSINELFPKCGKLAYDARQLLAQVQNGSSTTADLGLVIDELDRQLDVLETTYLPQTLPAQRPKWEQKLQVLRSEAVALRQQSRVAQQHYHYQANREALLRRRRPVQKDNESDIQNLSAEAQSLDQSHMMVNSLLGQGQANLNELVSARQRLRGVTGVLSDISNRLGVTQSTMRIIERRDITDAYLVVAGMILTALVFWLVWF
jgi:Golgi SNAP receptor complex protein 2